MSIDRSEGVGCRLAALAVALGVLTWASGATAAGSFAYRKTITFNGGGSGVSGSHVNFPVLISLVDPDLRDKVASPNGYDIVFRGEGSATCGGAVTSCALDHEIERWDPTAGTLVAWVRVPSLSAGTSIDMYYGNSQITAPTETPRAVWDASYVAVWHLGESGSGNVNEYRDSSRYGNHGQGGEGAYDATPSVVANAKIGRGQHFGNADGTYDLIDVGDDGTLRMTGNRITLEAWVRHGITINAAHDPYGILNIKGYWDGYRLALSGSSSTCGGAIAAPCLMFSLPGATDVLMTPQNPPFLVPNQWHHVVATYDGGAMGVFVDGVNQGWRAKTGNISPSAGGESLWIGHADHPKGQPWSGEFEGDLDEVRISRVARSTNWVATQFNNQNSPGAFYTVGPQATGPYSSPTTLAVNHRSIGTYGGTLYSNGTASVAPGATTVTLAGATLPTNVGAGDVLTFTGFPVETLYILSRDTDTRLTLQVPATLPHTNQGYTIARAYTSLQAWEADRRGDLVAENRREVGVAYKDGPLAAVTIEGSTTDPVHSIALTAAPGQRHLGRAGTGVVLDNGASPFPAIRILDEYVTVEWLEIRGGSGATAHGIELADGVGPANLARVANNVIHDVGGDGVRVGDPDGIVDMQNNVIYRATYGIHFPADMTADARVNVFNNTLYGCTVTGVESDVRQTSLRIDLRNNIAHGNTVRDFRISPFFDIGYFCEGVTPCTQIANGGVLGPNEYLADRTNNFTLNFAGTNCLYLGSSWKFRGVNLAVDTAGVAAAGPNLDLLWSYWNGTSWASLETGPFNDGSGNFVWEGPVYWPNDPGDWVQNSVGGSGNFYYVRACLYSGGYATFPVEKAITRVDVAIASRDNLASDITGCPHSALFAGQTGLDSVPLANVGFFNTTPGAENLHISAGSAAADAAADLSRVFVGDIDGAPRIVPWDIGADDALAGSGPNLSILKVRTSPPPVVPGGPVGYRMTVTNNGGGTVASVTVIETLPAIQNPVFTPSMGSYDPATGIWTGLNLGPSQSVTLDLAGKVDPAARGDLVNTVRVEPPPGVIDPDPSNDFSTVSDTLSPLADLSVDKTADVDPAELGGLVTYTLTVTNHGPSAAVDVTVTDPLPAAAAFDSAEPSQGTCNFDPATRVLSCPLADVPYPGTATVTLRVRPMALQDLTNTAVVGATGQPDPAGGNDSATVTIKVGMPSGYGVSYLTVTSTSGRNVVEWLNPEDPSGTEYRETVLVVRTERFPTSPTDGTQLYAGGTAGAKERFEHLGSPPPLTNTQTYYYGAFVRRWADPLVSPGRFVSGRPFDTSGAVKWAFSTGGFSVTPPTVGGSGVIAASNDMVVHAMGRGADSPPGGEWPAGWLPFPVSGPVQSRSPVVPVPVGAADPVVFLGSQDGLVYCLDGRRGGAATPPPWTANLWKTVQAAPAGIFSALGGGANDYVLVGTRDGVADDAFVALDPGDGTVLDSFDNGGGANGIGIISGMATVDYATARVYFASRRKPTGSSTTLWCLQLGPSPILSACSDWTPRALGDIDSSPVLRGGRIYVGSGDGILYSIDAATGKPLLDRTFAHGDGQVKGFVFPDRWSDDVYFATESYLWKVSDDGLSMIQDLKVGLPNGAKPSAALFVPARQRVYVGGTDGNLYEIDVASGATTPLPLGDGKAVVGAPSFDWENGLVHVGTEAGVFYAVSVPLVP